MSTMTFNNHILNLYSNLKYYAFSLTTNRDDADDLVQETYLKAMANREKFEENTNIRAWLYTIMRNTFINEYRRNKRSRTFNDLSKNQFYVNRPVEWGIDQTGSMIGEKEISKSIDGLEDDLKETFKMFTEGFKYREIAEKLDIPIGTVKSRIFITRQKLADELKEYR